MHSHTSCGLTLVSSCHTYRAHLDDIPREGRAPGANDDGSGSASLLAAAAAVGDSGFKFRRTLCFEHYTGEEQGLVGSRAQAELRYSRGEKVIGMIGQDMTALHLTLDEMGVAFVTDPRAVDPELTVLVESIARECVRRCHRVALCG